jgi:glycosyltransferase involved in cell wall biosynthesis
VRVAYLINQYPKVSHTFIRREIQALERRGIEILRFAVRGWSSKAIDPSDEREQLATSYLLRGGALPLLRAVAWAVLSSPQSFVCALCLAIRMARRADRSLPYHIAYLAEACLLCRWLVADRVDHVHAHFGTNAAEVAMLARELGGPPFSFTVHGPEEFDKPEFLGLGEKIRRSRFVVAVSSFGRGQLCRWVEPRHWSKIAVVRCGIEAELYREAPLAVDDSRRFVCVGRLCEQKAQLLLVRAAHRLATAGSTFEVLLVGDGEMRPAIEELIAELGLTSSVRITGWMSNDRVREEIAASRALVLPSFAEGLPVVLVEAMALGRPVVTTFVAGIPELVDTPSCGWLVPAGSVELLADAMQACLNLGPEARLEMGRTGRARALALHDADASAVELASLFSNPAPDTDVASTPEAIERERRDSRTPRAPRTFVARLRTRFGRRSDRHRS